MPNPGYLPAPSGGEAITNIVQAASITWVRRIVTVVNNVLAGRLNAVLPITLTASSTTTTIIDARISAFSALLFSPLSANAAAIQSSLYVSSQRSGEATLTHLSAAEDDLSFNLCIIG